MIETTPTEQQILTQFDRWNAALMTGNPANVAALYADGAILLPTMSNQVRDTRTLIEDYFVGFTANSPSGRIDTSFVRIFGQLAINSGLYTFTFADGSAVQARFTFVYKQINGEWWIVEHHSSAMPEG